jgi:hypothetical protein
VKYVLVSVKLVCVYVKLLKNLNASIRGIFYNYGKMRVVFAKYIWRGVASKQVKGGFANTFSYLTPYKKCVFTQKFHLKCMS